MPVSRPLYYREFAAASFKRLIGEGYCADPVTHYYYRMYARVQDNYAMRGYRSWIACCAECERCSCWCNAGYLLDPDNYNPLQDANFSSINPDTYANINVSVSGLKICPSPWQMGNEECHEWAYDHGCADDINGSYSLEWFGFTGDANEWCEWRFLGDPFRIAGCWVRKQAEARINMENGNWVVRVLLIIWAPPEPECPPCIDGHIAGCFGGVSGVDRTPCSSGSNTSDCGCQGIACCDGTRVTYDGEVTISWGYDDLVTPDYYIAKFTGEMVPCEGCGAKAVVGAAIKSLQDPAGWVLPLAHHACGWGNPFMPVPDTQPVSATGTITLTGQPADGNTITLDDGIHDPLTFELDDDDSVTESNIAVTIGANKEATMAALIGAINSSILGITAKASDPPDNICTLYNTLVRVAGNETITKVGANITVDGMSDGVAFATHHGWFWTVGLSMHNNAGDTDWSIVAHIVDFRHKHDEGAFGGIPGLKFNCPEDRNRHTFYQADATVALESQDCSNPPGLANDPVDMDCENEHVCEEAGPGYDICAPCAEGGTVELTGVT